MSTVQIKWRTESDTVLLLLHTLCLRAVSKQPMCVARRPFHLQLVSAESLVAGLPVNADVIISESDTG